MNTLNLSKDFVAASSPPLILAILARGDSYGYAILQEVRARSGGAIVWADGMLYTILHRLEKRGMVASYSGQAETGRKRKYYRLTDAGARELSTLTTHWRKVQQMLDSLDEEGNEHV